MLIKTFAEMKSSVEVNLAVNLQEMQGTEEHVKWHKEATIYYVHNKGSPTDRITSFYTNK